MARPKWYLCFFIGKIHSYTVAMDHVFFVSCSRLWFEYFMMFTSKLGAGETNFAWTVHWVGSTTKLYTSFVVYMVHVPQQVLSVSVQTKTTANTSHRCWFQVGAYLRDLKFPPFIMPLLQLEMGRTQISNSLLVEVLSIAPRKNLCH